MATRPIFITSKHTLQAAGVAAPPEGVELVDWLDICHGQRGKNFLMIDHQPSRSPSRWTYVENKLPWIVQDRSFMKYGRSRTFEGALKIARRIARESTRSL